MFVRLIQIPENKCLQRVEILAIRENLFSQNFCLKFWNTQNLICTGESLLKS